MNNYCSDSSEFLMALSICSSKTGECSTVENKQCRPRRAIHQEQQHIKTFVRLRTFYSDFQHTPVIQASSWPTALLPSNCCNTGTAPLLAMGSGFGAIGKSVKKTVEYNFVS
jgi:hypothetical protein